MIKRICSLWLSVLLLAGLLVLPVHAIDRVQVVNTSDLEAATVSGLPISSAYTRGGSFSLRWSGADLKRTVTLPAKNDWSAGAYLEFWVYSTRQTNSSFGLGLISDNPETGCVDYYETVINAGFKGWRLISIPFADFNAVHSPRGFHAIDRVELWPAYGGYCVDSAVDLYFDSLYVTTEQTQVAETDNEFVIYDFSSPSKLNALGKTFGSNAGGKTVPDGQSSYGLWWSDVASGSITFGERTDKNPMTSLPITDFTNYNSIEMEIYSENASGDTPQFVLRSEGTVDDLKNDYFYQYIPVDWTGWKTVTIRLGSMSRGQGPRGLDDICTIEFWMNNSVPEAETNLYIKNITLKNVDYEQLWQEPKYIPDAPETEDHFDFAARIKERFPNHQHPRLLMTQQELDQLAASWTTDEYLSVAVPQFLTTCDGYAEAVESPTAPSATSSHAASLALAWKITGQQKYKDAVWDKMLLLTKDAVTWNPNNSDLTIGDTCRTVAVAYDLMYNDWTEEQRMIVRNAMILYALEVKRPNLLKTNGADAQDTNWNAIINSGVGMAALAIADAEGYEGAANQYLNRIYKALRNLFVHYAPDGACFEGPDYYNYTMNNYMAYENALYNSVGPADYERFSILDEYGMEYSSDYVLHMSGTTGLSFNYYDGRARGCNTAADFWLARYTGRPELAGMVWEAKNGTLYNILMYRPNEAYKNWREVMPLDYHADGEAQVGAMRTDFEKGSQGFYVGYKGNMQNVATHGRLDAGAFVLDAMGTRWFELLDSETYGKIGMFGVNRYKYYRNRAEGSNTLVIGPGVHQGSNRENDPQAAEDVVIDQVGRSIAPITKVSEQNVPWASYAVVDLTGAYSQTASSAKRGYALLDGRNAFLLQDEITVQSACDVYSFMHTRADINVAADGQSAILSRGGKMMKVTLLSNCGATLQAMDAVALPTSPEVENLDNAPCRKLAVKARLNNSGTFAVLCTPYYGEDTYTYTLDAIRPLSQWDSFMEKPLELTGLYLDGVMLQSFSADKTVYSLKEESVGTISATAASGVSVSVEQAESVGETALVKATKGDQTATYAVTFTDDTQKMLAEWDSYPIKDYLYSNNRMEIPNMFDGNLLTGWHNEGAQWVAFDLGSAKPVHEVQIFWNNNDERHEFFDISVSNDGTNWTKVWEGESVLSKDIVPYTFEEVSARYVKVHGYYNTTNNWTSINELRITFSGSCFDDLEGSWAQQAAEDMAKVGLVEGTSDRIYSPDDPLSRAAFLTMLCRAFNLSGGSYSGQIGDIGAGDWYTPYIEAAYELGLIPAAMLEGGFRPDQSITREEICALAVSFYEHFMGAVTGADLERFIDRDQIAAWAVPYIEKCLALRFVNGMTADTFAPGDTATRGQAAAILKRIYIKIS